MNIIWMNTAIFFLNMIECSSFYSFRNTGLAQMQQAVDALPHTRSVGWLEHVAVALVSAALAHLGVVKSLADARN